MTAETSQEFHQHRPAIGLRLPPQGFVLLVGGVVDEGARRHPLAHELRPLPGEPQRRRPLAVRAAQREGLHAGRQPHCLAGPHGLAPDGQRDALQAARLEEEGEIAIGHDQLAHPAHLEGAAEGRVDAVAGSAVEAGERFDAVDLRGAVQGPVLGDQAGRQRGRVFVVGVRCASAGRYSRQEQPKDRRGQRSGSRHGSTGRAGAGRAFSQDTGNAPLPQRIGWRLLAYRAATQQVAEELARDHPLA
jgi:hypothetical protein